MAESTCMENNMPGMRSIYSLENIQRFKNYYSYLVKSIIFFDIPNIGINITTKAKLLQIAPATLFCCRLLHISPQSYFVTPCDNEVLQSVAV